MAEKSNDKWVIVSSEDMPTDNTQDGQPLMVRADASDEYRVALDNFIDQINNIHEQKYQNMVEILGHESAKIRSYSSTGIIRKQLTEACAGLSSNHPLSIIEGLEAIGSLKKSMKMGKDHSNDYAKALESLEYASIEEVKNKNPDIKSPEVYTSSSKSSAQPVVHLREARERTRWSPPSHGRTR